MSGYYLTAEPVGICSCPGCSGAVVEGENPPTASNLPDPWSAAS